MSPACKHSVRKLIPSARSSFHRETLKPSSEKFLTFVNPVFPARVEYMKRLPAWRFAEARTENNIDPTHSASWRSSPSERSNEFPGFSSRPGRGMLEEALAAAATSMPESRQPPCPHCLSDDVTHWGAAHGFPRYRCGSCRRTFNILTKTPLARLRNKDRWPTFVGTMIERRSIRSSAAACEVSVTTSSRWRKRFLECSSAQRAKSVGEVVAAISNATALTVGAENASADLA